MVRFEGAFKAFIVVVSIVFTFVIMHTPKF